MSRATISVLKFVGTVSLGLLTGISYTTSTQSASALLALPSAGTANNSFLTHKESTQRHILALSLVSATTFPLAFWLSPARAGRHPYLLWTSLVAAIGYGTATWMTMRGGAEATSAGRVAEKEQDHDLESYIDASNPGSSTIDLGATVELNGEQVRNAVDNWRIAEAVRAAISGLAFSMAVIGIWGDGSSIRHAAQAVVVA